MKSTLSPEAAAAIVEHMNADHADAIAGYARTFGNVSDVRAAHIVALDAQMMELAVDTAAGRTTARVTFDHVLEDTADARMTLIAMAGNIPAH